MTDAQTVTPGFHHHVGYTVAYVSSGSSRAYRLNSKIAFSFGGSSGLRYDTIGLRYDTRCYFNVRSKADMMSRLNLPTI